jgi:hypothetical protein
MREPVAASHFVRVCAGSITWRDQSVRMAGKGQPGRSMASEIRRNPSTLS